MIESYATIHKTFDRPAIALRDKKIVIQEKVDGSQFSFSKSQDGALSFRSRGAEIHYPGPEKMFNKAVETVIAAQDRLMPGWIYRAEYLAKPKHVTLTYDRVPKGFLALFDVETEPGFFAEAGILSAIADSIGIESVPYLYVGTFEPPYDVSGHLARTSFLGGPNIEGVVVKCYDEMDPLTKRYPLMAKLVSKDFQEKHAMTWKADNPAKGDIVEQLGKALAHENRWKKAIQHLRENGKLTESIRDIGPLMVEIRNDITKEESDQIAKALLKWAMPQVLRLATGGFPEWYKTYLQQQVDQA